MMMEAVLAVALGLVPVESGAPAVTITVPAAQQVKGYALELDRSGKTHLRGTHPRTGQPYHVTVSKDGDVEGEIGDRLVTFHVASVS